MNATSDIYTNMQIHDPFLELMRGIDKLKCDYHTVTAWTILMDQMFCLQKHCEFQYQFKDDINTLLAIKT